MSQTIGQVSDFLNKLKETVGVYITNTKLQGQTNEYSKIITRLYAEIEKACEDIAAIPISFDAEIAHYNRVAQGTTRRVLVTREGHVGTPTDLVR